MLKCQLSAHTYAHTLTHTPDSAATLEAVSSVETTETLTTGLPPEKAEVDCGTRVEEGEGAGPAAGAPLTFLDATTTLLGGKKSRKDQLKMLYWSLLPFS